MSDISATEQEINNKNMKILRNNARNRQSNRGGRISRRKPTTPFAFPSTYKSPNNYTNCQRIEAVLTTYVCRTPREFYTFFVVNLPTPHHLTAKTQLKGGRGQFPGDLQTRSRKEVLATIAIRLVRLLSSNETTRTVSFLLRGIYEPGFDTINPATFFFVLSPFRPRG